MSQENSRPWWVSSGPPNPETPRFEIPKPAENTSEEKTTDENKSGFDFSFLGLNPASQSELITNGLGLLNAVVEVLGKPLNGESQKSTHDLEACGICPLCVAVKAIRTHDENLADLIESAMKGVTSSAEKLKEVWPSAVDSLTESVVSAVVKAMMKR